MSQRYRFKVDKLIRDKLPQIMRESGVQLFERVMEEEEYLKRLKDKLLEEAKEVIASSSPKEIGEEMADLLEVMLALLKVYRIDFAKVSQTAEQKRAERGGFDGRIYSPLVEVGAAHPLLEYYRARPDQYRELE